MKFIPKELIGNVNVSSQSPLRSFFVLLGGIMGILLIVYILLGCAVDIVVLRIPHKIEEQIGNMYSGFYTQEKTKVLTQQEQEIQKILNSLVKKSSLEGSYTIHLVSGEQANAMAFPGGHIIVTNALLQETESENELAFILAHELGHFKHRDHLRMLGRGLIFFTLSASLFGMDSSVSQLLQNSLKNTEMKFSQRQEKQADLFGLELLNKRYGHVGGGIKFFQRLIKKGTQAHFAHFFATHPHPENRIRTLEQAIAKESYITEDTIPLSNILKGKSSQIGED